MKKWSFNFYRLFRQSNQFYGWVSKNLRTDESALNNNSHKKTDDVSLQRQAFRKYICMHIELSACIVYGCIK